jgi:hypothetical protein
VLRSRDVNGVRTVSKREYYALCVAAFALSLCSAIAIEVALGRLFRVDLFRHQGIYWASAIGFLVARAVDPVLRRLALSLSAKTLEIHRRVGAVAAELGSSDGEAVILTGSSRLDRRFFRNLALLFAVIFITMNIPYPSVASLEDVIFIWLPAVVLFFSLRRLGSWGRADGTGIWLKSEWLGAWTHLAWSDIASCEITTDYDAFGRPIRVMPVLKDALGKVLLAPPLEGIELADQERLAKYVRARLPKTKLDLAEL